MNFRHFKLNLAFLLFLCFSIVTSCSDHDEPQLAPIDTSLVKIDANIKNVPTSQWMIPSEQLSIKVSDVEMTALEGVILQSISLLANNGENAEVVVAEKTFLR